MLRRSGGVPLNICAPDEHVPEVERAICTVKERIRSVVSTLPLQALPEIMVVHVVLFSAVWLNFFPPQGGIHKVLSPEAIVKGRSVDSKLHCKTPFGGYAQVYAVSENEVNNAMVSRTVGGVSLGPTGNAQGTYKFVSLLTWKLIKTRSFTPLPMPNDVVKHVNAKAKNGNTGLVFGNRVGDVTIRDLDYNDPDNRDSDDDDDSYDDYASAEEDEPSKGEVEEELEGIGFGNRQPGRPMGEENAVDIPHNGELQGVEHGNNVQPAAPNDSDDAVQVHFDFEGEEEVHATLPIEGDEDALVAPLNENEIGIDQSILDIASQFEENLNNPNFSPASVVPSGARDDPSSVFHPDENPSDDVEEINSQNNNLTNHSEETDPETQRLADAPSPSGEIEENPRLDNDMGSAPYVTRAGRTIRPRRFLMHEGFGALTRDHGSPDLWRPLVQTAFGMKPRSSQDNSFFHACAVHH